ncbi:MAG TPA: hypothetical protein GX692_05115 [Acholeplasmataceae bacterium]|jgi:hypothetical protein|nr:hypothetical protein [Acholeplasmataceae bacterium]
MKKADIITIAIVFLISLSFYIFYITTYRIKGDVEILVYYQGEIIYQTDWEEDLDLVLAIGSEDYWTEEHKEEHGVDEVIHVDNDILNIVQITGREINMIEANCKNKYCLEMNITRKLSTAIICTNGVVVMLSVSEYGGTISGGIIWWK